MLFFLLLSPFLHPSLPIPFLSFFPSSLLPPLLPTSNLLPHHFTDTQIMFLHLFTPLCASIPFLKSYMPRVFVFNCFFSLFPFENETRGIQLLRKGPFQSALSKLKLDLFVFFCCFLIIFFFSFFFSFPFLFLSSSLSPSPPSPIEPF